MQAVLSFLIQSNHNRPKFKCLLVDDNVSLIDNCASKGAVLSNLILDGNLKLIFELKRKSEPFAPDRLISLDLFCFEVLYLTAVR
jgi:hypothetical protein